MPSHGSDPEFSDDSPPPAHSRRKRNREEYPDRPSKRPTTDRDVLFRLLVPSNRIGKVIGKQGMRIKQLREETGARIKIADPLSKVEERVILISSKDEALEFQCVAEQALMRVATLVIEPEAESTESTVAVGSYGHEGPFMARLLISGSQAGGVIGKAGATIKEIRETSGANVRVLTREHFPMCASAAKTDRLVQMYGEFPQVQRALELVAAKLRENPSREVVSLDLKPPLVALVGNSLGLSKISTDINVSSELVGGLIGKGGSNITRIRRQSGALIKVSEQEDGALERTILFEGTSIQVKTAQILVQAFLASKE